MNKITKLLVILLLFQLISSLFIEAYSQEWMKQCSSPGNDVYFNLWDVDNNNYMYCSSKYNMSIFIDDTAFQHDYPTYDNIAISIFNNDGILDRVTNIEPIPTGELWGHFLGADSMGNYYVSGNFVQRVFINGNPINHGNFPILTFDIFLAKLDSENNLIWTKTIAGNHHDKISGFVVQQDGSLTMVVKHEGASTVIYLDQDTVEYSNAGHAILKTNTDGEIEWRKDIKTGDFFYVYNNFELNNGNVFINGKTSGNFEFDGEVIEYGANVNYNSKNFILELDMDGNLVNGMIIPTNMYFSNLIKGPDNDLFFSTFLYSGENYIGKDTIYESEDTTLSIIGRMSKTFVPAWYKIVKKGGPGCPYFGITSNNDSLFGVIPCFYKFILDGQLFEFGMPQKILLMSFDHDGNWDYTRMFRSQSETGLTGLKLNKCNDLIMAGYFRGQTWFANDTLTSDSISFRDGFLTKLNRWGSLDFDIGSDTTVALSDMVYFEAPGIYNSYLWSTGDTTRDITIDCKKLGVGSHSIWCDVNRINNCYLSDTLILEIYDNTGIPETKDKIFTISPNPAQNKITISTNKHTTINQLNIYSQVGQKVLQLENPPATIDISSIDKGLFVVEIILGWGRFRTKLIKN
ncbi:MAG: T9SS type A sorting domain-containing protein [Chlorobi bacterium]|nr:T9SS type A sorting domain-containing protein [Chlorobiota bacterium]